MKLRPLHIGHTESGDPIFLSPEERTMGTHILGAPGSGKSQLGNYMIAQDVRYLPGAILVIDPHGSDPNSLYQRALAAATRYRPRRPMYWVNLSAPRFTYGFHVFAPRSGGDVSTRVQRSVRYVFTAWGEPDPYERPRALHWLTNTFAVGMERGDVGLAELRLLLDPAQTAVRSYLTANTSVAGPWHQLNQKRLEHFDEQIESTRNRIDALVSAAAPRRFLSLIHPTAMLDFRDILACRACVFVNLQASPTLDREHARVIGNLLIADFIDLACQRREPRGQAPPPVALYIDEAHLFASRDLAVAFEEGRKFGIYTTLMHQHLQQLRQEDERVLQAVLSAARTKIVFALGSDVDAKQMVHEVFVGPDGVNYTEVKHAHPNTKFRPVLGRDTSTTRSRGGGTARSHGQSRGTTTGTSTTIGESHTYGTGHDIGHSVSRGTSHSEGRDTGHSVSRGTSHSEGVNAGTTRSVGATHTVGRNSTRSLADGVAEGRTTSRSQTTGTAQTQGHSDGRGYSHGRTTTQSTTIQVDPTGVVTHTETSSESISGAWNDVEGFSSAQTTSDSTTEGESDSLVRTRVHTYAEGDSESDAEAWSEAHNEGTSQTETDSDTETDSESLSETDGETQSETDSQGLSETDGETDSETDSQGLSETDGETDSETDSESDSESEADTESESSTTSTSRTQGEDESRTQSTNWSKAITDGPVTRHQEFREDTVEFYGLEEQRQRLADALRMPPQRTFHLRRPDCTSNRVTVPFQKEIRLSERLRVAYEDACGVQTGAVPLGEADAVIAARLHRVTVAAGNFDGSDMRLVHCTSDDAPRTTITRKQPKPLPTLRPPSRNAKPPKGPDGAEG